jgi:hypothetical protein
LTIGELGVIMLSARWYHRAIAQLASFPSGAAPLRVKNPHEQVHFRWR